VTNLRILGINCRIQKKREGCLAGHGCISFIPREPSSPCQRKSGSSLAKVVVAFQRFMQRGYVTVEEAAIRAVRPVQPVGAALGAHIHLSREQGKLLKVPCWPGVCIRSAGERGRVRAPILAAGLRWCRWCNLTLAR